MTIGKFLPRIIATECQSVKPGQQQVEPAITVVITHGTADPILGRDLVQSEGLRHIDEPTVPQIAKQSAARVGHQQHILPAVIVKIEGGTSATKCFGSPHRSGLFRPNEIQTAGLRDIPKVDPLPVNAVGIRSGVRNFRTCLIEVRCICSTADADAQQNRQEHSNTPHLAAECHEDRHWEFRLAWGFFRQANYTGGLFEIGANDFDKPGNDNLRGLT